VKDPAFLFYVRDWLCSMSVQRMTGEQVKAYLYMLCTAWLEDESATLPADDESLAAAARVDLATWKRIKPAIMQKWTSDGNGRVFNDKLLEVHTHRKAKAANVRARWEKHKRSIRK
jgi:uncharacterized protein YdaU (DUF1376 family)